MDGGTSSKKPSRICDGSPCHACARGGGLQHSMRQQRAVRGLRTGASSGRKRFGAEPTAPGRWSHAAVAPSPALSGPSVNIPEQTHTCTTSGGLAGVTAGPGAAVSLSATRVPRETAGPAEAVTSPAPGLRLHVNACWRRPLPPRGAGPRPAGATRRQRPGRGDSHRPQRCGTVPEGGGRGVGSANGQPALLPRGAMSPPPRA